MSKHDVPPDRMIEPPATTAACARVRAPILARISAVLRPTRLDRILAVSMYAPAGTALAVHAARVTSAAHREELARVLRRALNEARLGPSLPMCGRIPIDHNNVLAAEELIDRLTLRLHSPRPVSARGMSRLRLLLSDGAGPLYHFGRGDLDSRLRVVLAAL
jgi:thiamine pyrophosphate-dependent acetolactate synthase large subunit-like protein